MKINRKDLSWFIKSIKHNNSSISDEDLVESLANYIEANPSCVDIDGRSTTGRYSYHTVGYGVFSLLGEFYRMGRIEVFDKEEDTGYASSEGVYCMPFLAANQFEGFINTLRTDFPIQIDIGSVKECDYAVSEKLGIPSDKLNDLETKKEFFRQKYPNNGESVFQ